ncbi:hypothetical protein [Gordonia alkanivorans]|uniref:Uncharacterized protein n=1 Tax=Gordonia alkanivorans NBRC 16433 TaxID=1027371 RepID=F9VU47_9ACTN|nr:hypothetical protein [Gordonia alkanivorans]GAA12136.1 hypothetical protein GOALK_048_00980 [Gordonia alkanivorans NBRC 16433]
MNGSEWVGLIHEIAWPVTVISLAVIFRLQLAGFLRRVSKLDFKGFGFEFAAALDNAKRAQAMIAASADATQLKTAEDAVQQLERRAQSRTEAALLLYQQVDALMSDLARAHNVRDSSRVRSLRELTAHLSYQEVLTPEVERAVDSFIALWERGSADPKIWADDDIFGTFSQLASSLVAKLPTL